MENQLINNQSDNGEELNREYKDSVFLKVFGEKDKLVELANAIFDANYTVDTPIDIYTIQEVIYRTWKNDISFILDNTYIVLTEHQSTINPNMPLRDLLYFAEQMKKFLNNSGNQKRLFSSTRIKIPRPLFIVMYNGEEDVEPETTINLTESFLGEGENALSLTVKVYNINKGSGCSLLEKSPTLYQYSQLVAMVRSYRQKGPVGHRQLQEIVSRCMEEGILVDFMKEYGRRGIELLCDEMTAEEARLFDREEGREEGEAIGMERLNRLNQMLAESGRMEDLLESFTDPAFQEELLKEFNL